MDEHAFPPTGFAVAVRYIWEQRLSERSCVTRVLPRPKLGASLLGGGSNVTKNTLVQRISGILVLVICKFQTRNFANRVSVEYIAL